ncbi:hypothetical protein [Pontibacter lucknowensis]|uniref:HEAT repeat-containing protein n=1 Tax=Pontibacter lucknowensis TaxID=1077936 RepID=A0A1N6YCI5_9BACT|nr:hypothetical protein [Pontibacter lucknowensis]SIR12342.1 hypothetical protein SAMN05421545_2415 [Pontibacter lucknowensis]
MTKPSTIFFASLAAGVLSMLDLRPAASTSLRLITGVEIMQQDTVKAKKKNSNVRIQVGGKGKDGKDGEQVYINTDDNKREELKRQGTVTLTDDLKDIKSISPNGYLKYMRSVNDDTKRLEITSDANGNLTRTYSENGKKVAYEPAGREWLQQIMPDLMANTGIGIAELVNDLYSKAGAKGVLAEAEKAGSEHAKMRFVHHLYQQADLKSADVKQSLQFVDKHVTSDYERRKALGTVAAAHLKNKDVVSSYLQVSGKINSDYERRKALLHLLETPDLSKESMAMALEQTGKISSDYEKAKVLQQLAKQSDFIQYHYKPAFSIIDKFSSDYEKAKIINAVVKNHKLSQAQYKELLPVVSRISSDYEKGKVLRNIASAIPADNKDLRAEVEKAANTIGSDYEKNKVISALR